MKKFVLWFAVIMCAGLSLAGISASFNDRYTHPKIAHQELLMAIAFAAGTIFLVFKAVKPGWRLIPESRKINAGDPLPVVNAPGIILSRGEICRLAESVKIGKTKTITTRTVTYRSGGSVRIAKGLSVHSGSSSSRPIRENILDAVSGTLYVTNRRIVASSQKYNFDKPLNALSSYTMYTDGFSLQFGKESFTFLVRDRVYIMTVLLSMVDSNG